MEKSRKNNKKDEILIFFCIKFEILFQKCFKNYETLNLESNFQF